MRLVKKEEFGHFPPKEGWKAHTWYLVEVAYETGNPVHNAILFTGFLGLFGHPEGYNALYAANAPTEPNSYYTPKYLKALRLLHTED